MLNARFYNTESLRVYNTIRMLQLRAKLHGSNCRPIMSLVIVGQQCPLVLSGVPTSHASSVTIIELANDVITSILSIMFTFADVGYAHLAA